MTTDNALEIIINADIQAYKSKNLIDVNLISDGFHTFGELYEHRITLFIALCRAIEGRENDAWKLWPVDGWFLMGIGKEKGKQITYHLPESRWEETNFCQVLTTMEYEYDGHNGNDVLERLKKL